jgi:dTDP-4-amino-4,6-dideoxygalactose transaminase
VLPLSGLRPVFVDIDLTTMTIDPAKIEAAVGPKVSGILGVHVYGTPCDVVSIEQIASRYGLRVIYDAAHAFGTRVNGEAIASFGDATMFSFHATKLFHTGEGGALAVQSAEMKKTIDLLRNFGIQDEFRVKTPGMNGKMNELQAALGLCVLEKVRAEKEKRAAVARIYRERLSDAPGITCAPEMDLDKDSLQYFWIRIDKASPVDRDGVYEELKKLNVFARKYFYPLCSEYECYRDLPSARSENLPVAHAVAAEVLCLPFFGCLAESDAERISEMVLAIACGL